MNAIRQDWEHWEATTDFRARVQASVARHNAVPEITPEDYLSQKRIELARQLDGKKLIYLDTKHWVNLCDVLVKRKKDAPVYETILGLLEALRQRNRICCPLSAALF